MSPDQPYNRAPDGQSWVRQPAVATPLLGIFEESLQTLPSWSVGPSMAFELDMVLWMLYQQLPIERLSMPVAELAQGLPKDWLAAGRVWSFARSPELLIYLAQLASVTLEGDYAQATLAMRDLDATEALERLAPQATRYGITPDTTLPPPARLATMELRLVYGLYEQLGFADDLRPDRMSQHKANIERAVRLLRGGEWHTRFWHWLDRFYYEFYQRWRYEQAARLTTLEQQAQLALGGLSGAGVPPLGWLPAQNALRQYKQLVAAVEAGLLHVRFWVEPTGIFDAMVVQPGLVMATFAPMGVEYRRFFQHIEDIAQRTHALGDPTRLAILRLIRQLSLSNTDIANYLEIARPTVSVHAKILREAGLIRTHPEGREVRHTIVPEEVRRLFRDLEAFLDLPAGDES